ncbi:MAG: hypothetical protein IKV21_02830 [Clostridia bacterium]|nr:hypothetical protein [Clostridia bacterium]
MVGTGKWQATVSVPLLRFSGDVFFTISCTDGKYEVEPELPSELGNLLTVEFNSIQESSATSLKGNGKISVKGFRELPFEATVNFTGDKMSGFLKATFANVKFKNGRRIG